MSLEALERSDLSRLPGGIFTRAFIRAYAQEVGLDPDRTIQDFIAELPSAAPATAGHAAGLEDGEKLDSDRKAVTTAIRLVLFSAPVIGLVTYYGTQRMPAVEDRPAPPAVAASSAATPEPAPPPAPSEPVAAAPVPAPAAAAPISGLRLEIAPKAPCWVSVTADGDQTFSVLMNAGETRVVTASEQILINVGDAGAFAYSLNGQAGKPLGAPGQVVSRRITLSNLDEFVAP
jgi:cytoskeletal protein RodZ